MNVTDLTRKQKSCPDDPSPDLSVRELIALLRKCPDQDAFVVIRNPKEDAWSKWAPLTAVTPDQILQSW